MSTDKPVFNKSNLNKKKIFPSEQNEPRKRKSMDLDAEGTSNDKNNEDPMMVLMGKLQQSVERIDHSIEQLSGINAVKKMSERLAEQAVSALGSIVFDKQNDPGLTSEPVKQNLKESRPFNLSPMADSFNEDSFLKSLDINHQVKSSGTADSASPELESSIELTLK
ncbi:hypothetical protein [Legionella bononiensis]|uniref:Coiled-coil protein n=1 Tax=Legionella bononiensis TaxID=2793102 RepID=A0ABS1WD30_9GAMM|nr:hypothetical protein [Legionella bononiensis]MBL7479042.1 hypothetical protein [Legionella bononiensis]MBL7527175.1 hypothetical protein [Legionella bononiensis]MBL7562144.1 hypothetical protein [Legionella bononiensis]